MSEEDIQSDMPPSFKDPQPTAQIHIHKPGRDPATFTVFKNFLCYYSEYFDAALNGSFIEGQTQEVTLEDVSVEVFGYFLQWVYTQTITNSVPDMRNRDAIGLWLFADRIIAPKLQNATMAILWQTLCIERSKWPSLIVLQSIYEETPKNSPLRRLIVQNWKNKRIKDEQSEQYPQQLLFDILKTKERGATPLDTFLELYLVDENILRRERAVLQPKVSNSNSTLSSQTLPQKRSIGCVDGQADSLSFAEFDEGRASKRNKSEPSVRRILFPSPAQIDSTGLGDSLNAFSP